MTRLPQDKLVVLEAGALKETKARAACGRRRTSALMPVFRVRGPLLVEAEHCGISLDTGLRKSGAAAVDVEIDVAEAS